MYRIFIVEDHAVMRDTFRDLIEQEVDMTVCGMAPRAADALQEIPRVALDLVLIDLSLPDMNGLELLKQLHATQPHLPALVVSGHQASQYHELAKHGGAMGYVDKMDAHLTLIPAIREVLNNIQE